MHWFREISRGTDPHSYFKIGQVQVDTRRGDATDQTSDVLKKLDAPTYVSIVNPRCCNYYFRMFHGDCCMKHGVQVAAEFSYPRVKQLN